MLHKESLVNRRQKVLLVLIWISITGIYFGVILPNIIAMGVK